VEQTPTPFVCLSLPPYLTQYTSGMVSTYQRFNRAYGLFEVRAKISSATEPGLQTSFWLYPAKLTYGAWPASGEVDIAELFSQYPTLAIPSVHYDNSDNDPSATNNSCVIGDPGQFHTYALGWTPQSMTSATTEDLPGRQVEPRRTAGEPPTVRPAVLHLPHPGPRDRDQPVPPRRHSAARPTRAVAIVTLLSCASTCRSDPLSPRWPDWQGGARGAKKGY